MKYNPICSWTVWLETVESLGIAPIERLQETVHKRITSRLSTWKFNFLSKSRSRNASKTQTKAVTEAATETEKLQANWKCSDKLTMARENTTISQPSVINPRKNSILKLPWIIILKNEAPQENRAKTWLGIIFFVHKEVQFSMEAFEYWHVQALLGNKVERISANVEIRRTTEEAEKSVLRKASIWIANSKESFESFLILLLFCHMKWVKTMLGTTPPCWRHMTML